MNMRFYLLNRTYIAEDQVTGLVAYADSLGAAESRLRAIVDDYWEKRKVIVPIETIPTIIKRAPPQPER